MDTKPKQHLRTVNTSAARDEPVSGSSRLGNIVRQLRQRKVCRAAITYALILWLNLQIGDIFFPVVGLPDWTLHFVLFIGIMGFPVVLLLAWLFQITPNGLELDLGPPRPETATDRYLERTVSVLLLVLSFTLTLLLTIQFMDSKQQAPQTAAASIVPCGVANR